ncbi:MAG TPA: hypothetical protein VMN99_06245 [Anaerolineales bacterium]|nr:hypothetical protein [Anaerolineales bacterium]
MTVELISMFYPPIALTLITIIIVVVLVQVFVSYRARLASIQKMLRDVE